MKKEIIASVVIAAVVVGLATKEYFEKKEAEQLARINNTVETVCLNVGPAVDDVSKSILQGYGFDFIKSVSARMRAQAADMVGASADYTKQYAYFTQTAGSLIILSGYTADQAKTYLQVECRQQVIKALGK